MQARAAIYLDCNAGAPLRPEVVKALRNFLENPSTNDPSAGSGACVFANPSSVHVYGRNARRLIEEARGNVASAIDSHAQPDEIIFTSSGTESNQLAIRAELESKLASGLSPEWLLTPVEHDSVLQLKPWVESRGGTVRFIPVDNSGAPILEALNELLSPQTALVSLIWVNNETGVVSDVEGFAKRLNECGVPLHLDAAQAWGKFPLAIRSLGAQYVSFSGHKVGALNGTGVLWVDFKQKLLSENSIIQGRQEKGRRGGTENLLGIYSLGVAARYMDFSKTLEIRASRDRLEKLILNRISGVTVNGSDALRVHNTLNVSFEGIGDNSLVIAMDLAGFSLSAGSACSSGIVEPSHVLTALGRTRAEATAALRISLDRALGEIEIESFIRALEKAVERSRQNGARQ